MDRLQLFTIFTSVWLRAIGALLAASLIACTVHRIPGTWRTMTTAARGRRAGLLRARAPARGDDLPPRSRTRSWPQATGGLQAPPLPDRHRGRRHRPPLRGPQPLGAVGGPGRPHQHRGDPGRRDGRLDVRLPRRAVHAGRGLHLGDPDGWPARRSPSTRSRTPTTPTTGAPLDYVSDVTVTQDGQVVVASTAPGQRAAALRGHLVLPGLLRPGRGRDREGRRGQGRSSPRACRSPGPPTTAATRSARSRIPDTEPDGLDRRRRPGPNDPDVKPGQIAVELYKSDTRRRGRPEVDRPGRRDRDRGPHLHLRPRGQVHRPQRRQRPGHPARLAGLLPPVVGFVIRLYVPYRRVWGRLVARPGGGTSLSIAAVGRRDTGFDDEFTTHRHRHPRGPGGPGAEPREASDHGEDGRLHARSGDR